ncbi:MAG: hypothetical protein JW976_00200 [Syntrophaceae bacterium]|nr:hypothetical protein [Syntrophaceae bacterium]
MIRSYKHTPETLQKISKRLQGKFKVTHGE